MLSCSCDIDHADWYYYSPNDFTMLNTKRRRRCCSCRGMINIGTICIELQRYRDVLTDIEESIEGSEVPLASWYLCEWCGEMYFNFEALGYCYWAGDDLREYLRDYWDLTGHVPDNKQSTYVRHQPPRFQLGVV